MRKLVFVLLLLFGAARLHADTPTFTATVTPTYSQTSTATPTFTATPSSSQTKTLTSTLTVSQTSTRTVSPTLTRTPTNTTTPTYTITLTLTPSPTPKPWFGPQNELVQPNGTPVPYANTFKSFSAQSVSGATAIWTPASGKKPRVLGGTFSGSVAGDYVLFDSGNTIYTFTLEANKPFNLPPLGGGRLASVSNTAVTLKGPVAATTPCQASGTISGSEE